MFFLLFNWISYFKAPWCMIFIDCVVLVNEYTNLLESKLEHRREILEKKNGLKINTAKTEFLKFRFNNKCK